MKAYHGTTAKQWERTCGEVNDGADSGTIYLTISRDEAVTYAEEASEHECMDLPEEEWSSSVLVVVEVDIDDLQNLEGVTLEPDWGWEAGFADGAEPTWDETMEAVGSFAVGGFRDEHKSLFTVTPAYENAPGI